MMNPEPTGTGRLLRASHAGAALLLAALLFLLGRANLFEVNPDAVSYMRIARYWLEGRTGLAVNGYWGPLLSWLMVPWMAWTGSPLVSARMALAVSAALLYGAGLFWMRVMELPAGVRAAAAWPLAIFCGAWSVRLITPDPLMAALFLAGAGLDVRAARTGKMLHAAFAGVFFGLAYMAKAVALPAAALWVLLHGAYRVWASRGRWREPVLRGAAAAALTASVSLPWIAAVSADAGQISFSASGGINHAIAGPPDVERYHPTFREFHVPEEGRITSWEDPTAMSYPRWSPLERMDYLRHQLKIPYWNANHILHNWTAFDWLYLTPGILLIALCVFAAGRPEMREVVCVSLIAAAANSVFYLPVYAADLRYYLVTHAVLFAAGPAVAVRLPSIAPRVRLGVLVLLLLNFAVPAADFLAEQAGVEHPEYLAARKLAAGVRERGLDVEAVAGVDDPLAVALYLAFQLDVPYYGNTREVPEREVLNAHPCALVVPEREAAALEGFRVWFRGGGYRLLTSRNGEGSPHNAGVSQ
ncbi:hypothetical protein [Kiritimatiella glycovorans]|uniref:Glycosyltransferase RgtA/B/C/D-like domain-containing protein n=1 Tax=Kiritimatiella glycovorans TaxID=1307763 RepID=A0A0G3EAJ8_9BACT|nr:hypothetical protein [Kiritimatiella glycovorans]AKJ63481.1 hypothetical protein L21SP4_00197 [Kiritimatiella glycovorans]